jgi:hypothetical protein
MDKCQHEWGFDEIGKFFYCYHVGCYDELDAKDLMDKWQAQGERIKALEDVIKENAEWMEESFKHDDRASEILFNIRNNLREALQEDK